MSTLSEKGEAAYAEAGKVAEEVNPFRIEILLSLFQNLNWYLILNYALHNITSFCPNVWVDQVISQVRTVYSFVGEEKAAGSYSKSLDNALKLGKKGGFAKGVGVGFTYGLLFCAWALLLWYASILVRHHKTNGGKAFTTIINVIFSGL